MYGRKNKNPLRKGLTLLEMVIALAMIVIISAAILPQLKSINDGWASKRANAEVLQNARVFVEQINRSLSSADRVTDVSDPCNINGYIEFEDNTGTAYRIDIAANNYIEFGPVGSLSDFAGPVSQLKITCYDDDDLDTPVDIAVDGVDGIRYVECEIIFTNPGPGLDRTFTTGAYLRTNANNISGTAVNAPFEFDSSRGKRPALAQIDPTHYLCAYEGQVFSKDEGWAVVLEVNPSNWLISAGTPFRYESDKGKEPDLAQIDTENYFCVYKGAGDDGWATVLKVDTDNWTVSEGTPYMYSITKGKKPALARIDTTHYLCAYEDQELVKDEGWASVLALYLVSTTISKESGEEEFDVSMPAIRPDGDLYIAQICLKGGEEIESVPNGWTEMTDRDRSNNVRLATYWKIGSSEPATYTWESDEGDVWLGAIHRISGIDTSDPINVSADNEGNGPRPTAPSVTTTVDDCLILRMYAAEGDEQASTYWPDGATAIFQDDSSGDPVGAAAEVFQDSAGSTGTGQFLMTGGKKWVAATVAIAMESPDWKITSGSEFKYDAIKAKEPALTKIDDGHYLCAYKGADDDGWATVLKVDPDSWALTQGTPFEFETGKAKRPALEQIDGTHYLCVYSNEGVNKDEGWATVLNVNTGSWHITNNTPYVYEPTKGKEAALAKIDSTSFLCVYESEKISKTEAPGWATVMTVDTDTWTLSSGTPFKYDPQKGKQAALAEISNSMFLCAYAGDGDDGWAVVIQAGGLLRP